MGYRSEVLFKASSRDNSVKEAYLKLKMVNPELLKTLHESFGPDFMPLANGQGIDLDNNEIRIHYENSKWYEHFPDVQAAEEFFHFFDMEAERDGKIHTVFIRIGEDMDDLEHRYTNEGYDLATPTRTIHEY